MDRTDKSPSFVHKSPEQTGLTGDDTTTPLTGPIPGNLDDADFGQVDNNLGATNNIQMIQKADDDDSSSSSDDNLAIENKNNDNNTNDDDDDEDNENEIPLSQKHRKKGNYNGVPTKSYSELMNASMYSLKENESIIDIGIDDKEQDDDDGWPHFEPLDGPYPCSVYRKDYKQLKNEILSGLVVSFAQVPEAVAFSFLAGFLHHKFHCI